MAAALSGRAVRAVEVGSTVRAATKDKRVRLRGGYAAAQRPTITTLTVTVGLGFLHAWLVEHKPTPDRSFLVKVAILGFILSLMTEITPKFGKGMSYLVLTGVVFDRSQDILRELNRKPKKGRGTDGTGGTDELTPPFAPDTRPVTLYVRQGPMTTEPLLPSRSRIKRPQRGAAFQTS